MRVLIACEESQAVTKAFRAKGHEAYSCDIKPCSGGHPEWHLQGDVFSYLQNEWDILIAHPPCTYLTVTGNAWFNVEKYGDKAKQRHIDRLHAAEFFTRLFHCNVGKIAIENPIGFMNHIFKPSQIVQPYFFGDEAQKTTCLWLKGLPLLMHNKTQNLFEQSTHVSKGEIVEFESGCKMPKWYADAWALPKHDRAELRSKTFPGLAQAMATQWG